MKDLNLLQKYTKDQETGYNFRLGFALSNRPHLHRVYLVTVYIRKFIAVQWNNFSLTHYVSKSFIQIFFFWTVALMKNIQSTQERERQKQLMQEKKLEEERKMAAEVEREKIRAAKKAAKVCIT